MGSGKQKRVIPGTTVFDGDMARKGYALNKMCFSFNSADNRADFLKADPAATATSGASTSSRRRRC